MKSFKLVSLQLDNTRIQFKDGRNYIVGNNATGKTTFFNCIKYALGLTKFMDLSFISHVELEVCVDEYHLKFIREVGSVYLAVSYMGETQKYQAFSQELDDFFKEVLLPTHIYGSNTESALALLNFCFLSEERATNRRNQWDAICSICGINVSLLKSVVMDIQALKSEVANNKKFGKVVDEFAQLLTERISENCKAEDLNSTIQSTKEHFFGNYREKEYLLENATIKLETIKKQSESELKLKLSEVEDVFFNLNQYSEQERASFDGLEVFVKGRNKGFSYSEEIISRFILVLAIARVSQDGRYNFPMFIVNDSYLSFEIENKAYQRVQNIVDSMRELQYIEFTCNEEVPKEYVVLNLNAQGGQHVFGS